MSRSNKITFSTTSAADYWIFPGGAIVKVLLQGKWLGHPIHPIIVSLPLGLWPISFVLDVIGTIKGDGIMFAAAFYALLCGLAGALAAVITGGGGLL